jgi:signal transduction histidine kinase
VDGRRNPGDDLIWVVPLGGLVVVGAFLTNLTGDTTPRSHEPWLAAALGLVSVAGIIAALRWPRRGAALTYAAVTVHVLVGVEDGPIYLALAGAGFLVTARVSVSAWARVVGAGSAAVGAALLVRTLLGAGPERSGWQLLAMAALTAAGAAGGTLVRARATTVSEQTRAASTREQLHRAQELHDGVGHGLAVIAMQAGVGLHVLDRDPAAVRTTLEVIRDSARESLDALRAELAVMAGDAPRRPHRGVADIDRLIARVRAAGVAVDVDGVAEELPEGVDVLMYAVVQESLTNVLKHAGARHVQVRWDRSPEDLSVTVSDDGSGAERPTRGSAEGPAEGMGLTGLRRRVEERGGRLTAGPGPAGGFVVRAEVPW